MATPIVVGLATYLEDFDGGQTGLRTPPYTQYATDLDTNFLTLRTTVNQLIGEVNAVQGPNAGLAVDLAEYDDPQRGGGSLTSGVVGLGSFRTFIGAPTSELDVNRGVAVVAGLTVRNAVGATLVGSGGAGTRWVAIDVNGTIFQETAAAQRALDVWSATWNGAAFTAVTRLAAVFWDGDDQEALRKRTATGTAPVTFATQEYDQVTHRVQALERLLAGFATDSQGFALGQPALRLGTAGAPGLAFEGDPNTGPFAGGADTWNLSTGGTSRLSVTTVNLVMAVAILALAGTAALPGYAISGDPNTGVYGVTGDTLGFATAGVHAAQFDPQGNLDLALNARVKGMRTAVQSIADNTPTLVSFTAADAFDVPAATPWHNAGGGAPGDQEFTVPTGGDGLYHIQLNTEWASPAVVTDFLLEITVNGTALQEKKEDRLLASGSFSAGVSVMHPLVAADVVRARVTQIDTVGAAALDLQTASLSIVKVA